MMKWMMQKMMPMMCGTMKKLDFDEKEKMMDQMMPHMMIHLTFEEKMKLMRKIMPLMMQDISMNQVNQMMDTMIPMVMSMMEEKGIDMFRMMEMMCPKCLSVATANATKEEKHKLKSRMTRVFSEL